MAKTPIRIEPFNAWEMLLTWNTGERIHVPYRELRFACPCAACVDELSGQRTLRLETIPNDIKPTSATVVGKYALQISWSDGHETGMYHFDRLWELCQARGQSVPERKAADPS